MLVLAAVVLAGHPPALDAILRASGQARAPEPALLPFADAPGDMGGWIAAPAYLDLFAPQSLRAAYRAYVSPRPLDDALRSIATVPSLLHPPGAWASQAASPADAFGQSGPYNRWTVARLYGPNPVHVARGPRGRNGRADESWTLLSPYPSRDLRQLEPGTLLLIVQMPPL